MGQAMDEQARTQDRLLWVDTAKGLGIILVVAGHVWTRGAFRDAIYAFHMPLFFLLAGYFARPRPMKAFAIRQWHSMAVPYIAFLLSLALVDQLIEHARGHLPLFRTWQDAAWALLVGGSELRGPMTIFWFPPCLLFARLIQNALAQKWPDPRDWHWGVVMAVSLIFGLSLKQSDFSPLGLLAVPVALVLLWLGALWRTMEKDGWLLLAGLLVGGVALALMQPVPLNMKVGRYGLPYFSLGLSVALSLGLCAIARILSRVRVLALLGQRSLTIMYCHVAIIHYGGPYASKAILFLAAVLLPLIVHEGLARTGWGRRYFLGMGVGFAPKSAPN